MFMFSGIMPSNQPVLNDRRKYQKKKYQVSLIQNVIIVYELSEVDFCFEKKFLREFIKGKVQDIHALRIGNNGVTKHNQL